MTPKVDEDAGRRCAPDRRRLRHNWRRLAGTSAPSQRRPARQRRAPRWALCAAFAAAVTLLILQYSFRHGRLILFPTYDDVGYLADGLQRLQTFYDWGWNGVIDRYQAQPPHSPFSSLMAAAGFALFGYHDWAPYVMNALLALGYFLLADYLLRGAAFWQKVLCFTFVAALPFVGLAVHEFRPDHAAALFTAAGALLLLGKPFVYGGRGRQLAAGSFFAAAMLAKPPVFPQTLAVGGASLLLATLSDWAASGRRPRAGAVALAWATVLAPFILLPLPHYLHDRRHIFGYIYEFVFSESRHSYQKPGPLSYQLRYYLDGEAARIMLGRDGKLLALLLCAGGAWAAAARRRADAARVAALLAVLLLAYLIPAVNTIKQEFFGLAFDTLLAFCAVLMLGRLLAAERVRRGRLPWASVLLVFCTISAVYWFQWPRRVGNRYSGWQQNRREIAEGVFHEIVSHCTFGGAEVAPAPDWRVPPAEKVVTPTPTVLFCGVGDVNDQLFNYLALKYQYKLKAWFPAGAKTAEELARDFDRADFIVAAESGTGLVAGFLAFSPWQDQLLAAARARPDFREAARFTFRKTGRSFYVFRRTRASPQPPVVDLRDLRRSQPFGGFTPGGGLGDVEGPSPTATRPAARPGYGPATVLRVKAPADGAYEVYWDARPESPGQRITIRVDGHWVEEVDAPGSPTEFAESVVPIWLRKGEHEIELVYAKWHPPAALPAPAALLFRSLRVDPKP